MKTFEERYTAWIDGRLDDVQAAELERELESHGESLGGKSDARKLGNLLRAHPAPQLTNQDFFNSQLMARIHSEEVTTRKSASTRSFFFAPWFRAAWAGALALVLGWVLGRSINPNSQNLAGAHPNYPMIAAHVLQAKPAEPTISATVLQEDGDDVTVLWLDGLEYLPASYELQ